MNDVIKIFVIVITPILGLIVGSFLNVVIYRLGNDMSLVKPNSQCPKCHNPIKWYDNIPVLSFIILRGRCRHCKEKISFRYPAIELLNAVMWTLCLLCFTNFILPDNPMSWYRFIAYAIACSTLICIFFIDLDKMIIPEVLQLILLLCGVVLLLEDTSLETIMLKVFGFLGAGLLFYIVNLVFKLIRKRDGIGFGDIELVALAGLILGGYRMIYALLIGCVGGALIYLVLFAFNKNRDKEYPFAPMLVSGIVIAMFTGDYVINWYLNLLGGVN